MTDGTDECLIASTARASIRRSVIERLQLEPDPDGINHDSTKLKRREDGACVHLGEHGCTVHEYRSEACRVYNCITAATPTPRHQRHARWY